MEIKDKFQILLNQGDTRGDKISLEEKENRLLIFFKQADEKRTRQVGEILVDGENEFTYYKMEDESQIFNKNNGWSVMKIIAKEVGEIIYETPLAKYSISRKDAFEQADQYGWDPIGLGKKLFIPVRFWTVQWKDKKLQKNVERMGYSWARKIGDEFDKNYMRELSQRLYQRSRVTQIYPDLKELFTAFKLTPFDQVKVCVIGDEPYQDEKATGLAYSYPGEHTSYPKEIEHILLAVENDVYEDQLMLDPNRDLTRWAEQGVLLLNSSLSAEYNKPGLHKQGDLWKQFIQRVISELDKRSSPTIFLLFGEEAWQYEGMIDHNKNLVIREKDPKTYKFGESKPFSKTNEFLKDARIQQIHW
jgi:uracil-DNA glycosylase